MNKYRIEKELVKARNTDEINIILSEVNDIDTLKEIIKMLLDRIYGLSFQQMISNISNDTSQFGDQYENSWTVE